jgi:protein-arginine deiminase
MTYHHLLTEESVYALKIPGMEDSLVHFADLQAAADEVGVPLDDMSEQLSIAIDQWTQDYMEFGYMSMPAAGGAQHVVHVAYRAANLEGLTPKYPLRKAGRVVFTKFRGPDFAGVQEYLPGHSAASDSLNSFGNWETIPPHTAGGAIYPLGRLMVGSVEGFAPDPNFLGMVEAQGWQPSVHIDTSWLAVGHVDETLSFAKADNARGWILLVNDPLMAKQMLEEASSGGYGDTLMFAGMETMYGQPAQRTIDQVLADPEVMGESADSAVEVEAQVQTLRDAIDLEDEQIVLIPYLHERVMGKSLAYNPATINSLYIADDLYAAPETHGPEIEGVDIFKAQFEAAMAAWGIGVAWVENWNLYHILWGEVHCGTNSLRATPEVKWWEVQR